MSPVFIISKSRRARSRSHSTDDPAAVWASGLATGTVSFIPSEPDRRMRERAVTTDVLSEVSSPRRTVEAPALTTFQ